LNNHLALRNTSLISAYVGLDPRVRQLLFLIKHWAKCRSINETYTGTLSSYAYVLLAINFLQRIRPPVLPCLQDKQACEGRVKPVFLDGFDCTFYTPASNNAPNTDSLARLVLLFFRYYAHEFCWAEHVVTVRSGGVQRKKEKDWLEPDDQEELDTEADAEERGGRDGDEEGGAVERRSKKRDHFLVAIEDPFEVSHNLGRVVDRGGFETLRYEFARCYHLLASSAPLELVFQPYQDPAASFMEAGAAVARLRRESDGAAKHKGLSQSRAVGVKSADASAESRSQPRRARSSSSNPTAHRGGRGGRGGGGRSGINSSNSNSHVNSNSNSNSSHHANQNGHRSRSRSSGGRRRGGGGGGGGGGGNRSAATRTAGEQGHRW
jgi:DNA polymerase sigma